MAEKQKDNPGINKNIHPPFVALFFIAIAIILQRFASIPLKVPAIAQNIGFGLTFIGFLCGVGAFIEFRKARTTLDPHGSVKALVTGGIYRITRNPIYLGFLLMVIGFPLNYGSLWGIVAAPLFAATMSRLVIQKEEAYLEKKFKEQYTSYSSRVRRWL
jgi:protein-S-isoprenylcysteine O-methyltransferase Ste14